MGRPPCCVDTGLKKGPWTPEEDQRLVSYIKEHGHGSWRSLPKLAGLNRCGKSCRLRWTNYLRPDIKRGKFSAGEEQTILNLHSFLGNKWSAIATHLPGRTDNEIKNFWNTHLKKRLIRLGIDPATHRPRTDVMATLPHLIALAGLRELIAPAAHPEGIDGAAAKLQQLLLLLQSAALPPVSATPAMGGANAGPATNPAIAAAGATAVDELFTQPQLLRDTLASDFLPQAAPCGGDLDRQHGSTSALFDCARGGIFEHPSALLPPLVADVVSDASTSATDPTGDGCGGGSGWPDHLIFEGDVMWGAANPLHF